MAIYNYVEAAHQQRKNDAYCELLKYLDTKKGQKKFPLWFDLLEYLKDRNNELEKANKKIKEYQNFFSTLSSFLPHRSSIRNIIR